MSGHVKVYNEHDNLFARDFGPEALEGSTKLNQIQTLLN